jgi:hypothetical protein
MLLFILVDFYYRIYAVLLSDRQRTEVYRRTSDATRELLPCKHPTAAAPMESIEAMIVRVRPLGVGAQIQMQGLCSGSLEWTLQHRAN